MIHDFPKHLTVADSIFHLQQIRRDKQVAIYRRADGQTFLRIGEPAVIEKQYQLQQFLKNHRFPVAEVRTHGQYDDWVFYIESSCGDRHFGEIFSEGMTPEVVTHYGQMVIDFVATALAAPTPSILPEAQEGLHIAALTDIFATPEARQLQETAQRVLAHLQEVFSMVFTHGDLNPFNVLAGGVIDFESSFIAPAGYDAVVALVHQDSFPLDKQDGEIVQSYQWTPEQVTHYRRGIVELFDQFGLPDPFAYEIPFRFLRMIWSVHDMAAFPRLQAFRQKELRHLHGLVQELL